MNSKQFHFHNNWKTFENNSFSNTGNLKMLDFPSFIVDYDKTSKNSSMLQLQEKEALNAHLVKLVEQGKKELTDAVATNKKFISIIAHDLRGPFNSILLALELLKQKLDDNNLNDIENHLIIATDSVNKTLNLLNNLLTWTISQNNEKKFNPVKINLYQLLLDEIDSIKILANQKNITLNHTIYPKLNLIADLQMVKTILRNLIGNAIKYTNSGGEINIRASEKKQLVKIGVIDTGIGISQEVQKNLFKTNSFYSTAGTNNEIGTGLGLLLCKEFVELHGGNIWVESEPEKGSKFEFTLPLFINN